MPNHQTSSKASQSEEPVSVVRASATAPVALGAGAALICLLVGATALGLSPVFVRNAEIGPFASAFWRATAALPLLVLWSLAERRMNGRAGAGIRVRNPRALVLAGLFFAGDLTFWHLAILNTTIAKATFLACLAPVWVALFSKVAIGEPVTRQTLAGLAICLPGAALLIFQSTEGTDGTSIGDLYGAITSVFFGLYFLAMREARKGLGGGESALAFTLVTAAALLPVALLSGDRLVPPSASGIANLAALGLVSHAGGQGLLSVSLGVLSASFSSLVIFAEAIAAALFGWLFAGEAIGWLQAAGGLLIFVGIFVARPRRPSSRR